MLVLKTLNGDPRMPYFALLTEGFPRLVTISPTQLDERADAALDDVVAAAVRFQDEDALVPDLDAVERRLQTAIAA